MPKILQPKMLAFLQTGDGVIGDVKSLLPYGAANQKGDVADPKHSGETYSRTRLAQDRAMEIGGAKETPNGPIMAHVLRMAGAALTFGAGNCQEQAALAYALLRERLDKATYASFCVYQAILFGHAFAAIGRPYVDPDDEVVIVDPWPIKAQAVLWKDHFCYEAKKSSDFHLVMAKTGGKDQGRSRKWNDDIIAIDKTAKIEQIINIKTDFDRQYCSRDGGLVSYTKDLISFD